MSTVLLQWIWYTCFGAQTFSDCSLFIALCVILAQRRTGFKRSDSLIQILIFYSIGICVLTSAISLASVITNVVLPGTFVPIAIIQVLPTLMYNSLLALLNSRDALLGEFAGQVVSIHLSRLRVATLQRPAPEAAMSASWGQNNEAQVTVNISVSEANHRSFEAK
ncbi:hypothetical protein PsYK624_167340 [Phanerochaete sordida]|uniref:DUF6534 domain-containing protein n=1 Tax=Phanerochaete sordida TaxID=48140 RepID=A0A9P3GRD1_9APHY|nr:hypothetical protein PsYK624_167340 [Phanerochaete sordida]